MFTGFTPETVDFLWGIRMNNNRDWFLEHKKQYVEKDNGEFEVMEVSNSNDLNNQFTNVDNNQYFIDFASANSDEVWAQILGSKQSITTLNVSLSSMQKMLKSAYTVTITPQATFDAMIVFQTVTPSTILSE